MTKLSDGLMAQLKRRVYSEGLILYGNKANSCFPADSYGYITDGRRVIYWQGDEFYTGIQFVSCCFPQGNGTGYQLHDKPLASLRRVSLRGLLEAAQRQAHWLRGAYKPRTIADLDLKGFHIISTDTEATI